MCKVREIHPQIDINKYLTLTRGDKDIHEEF